MKKLLITLFIVTTNINLHGMKFIKKTIKKITQVSQPSKDQSKELLKKVKDVKTISKHSEDETKKNISKLLDQSIDTSMKFDDEGSEKVLEMIEEYGVNVKKSDES